GAWGMAARPPMNAPRGRKAAVRVWKTWGWVVLAPPARAATEALDGHPATRARRRAIGLALLATAQVQQREVEQACHTGVRAAELLGALRSSRGTEYLDDLRERLEPFREEPAVREFAARLEPQAA
ncbi:hypothetical protein ACE14D_27745, partial [Streptomyces sp. Act-28]